MNQIYSNFVLSDIYETALTTALDMQQFVTVDSSLTEEAGMIKKINKRNVTGSVEDVAEGQGNTETIEVALTTTPYEVTTTQGRFVWSDEAAMTDDKLVEAGLTGLSEKMVNDFTSKAVAEWDKATLTSTYTSLDFDAFADALAVLNREDESDYFALMNVKTFQSLRKSLKDELKYVEAYARKGYVGSVCGVNVYTSKAIADDTVYIASKEAVTLFLKKGTEIENDRVANTRTNTTYARKVAVVALTDASKVVKMSK